MVTISDYRESTNKKNEKFYSLILQGDVELVQSQSTGQFYATARKTSITSTFDEAICKSLVGKTMAGTIEKVESEPYQYTVEETGEQITLTHRFVFVPEGQKVEGQIEEVKTENSFIDEGELVH